MSEPIREALAAYAHDAWAGWMRYLFDHSTPTADGSVRIPSALVRRWERQIATPYADLPPNEQASDLAEADKMLVLVAAAPPRMSEPIRAQEREDWQAACDAATPGPWRLTWDSQDLRLHQAGVWEPPIAEWGYAVSPWRPESYEEVDRRDADFMVIAREALPRLLAENAALQAERDAARDEINFEQHKLAGVLATNSALAAALQAARDEVAGYRAQVQAMRERWAMEHDGTILQSGATQPPLPDPPDPAAPQQLGLLEDGP